MLSIKRPILCLYNVYTVCGQETTGSLPWVMMIMTCSWSIHSGISVKQLWVHSSKSIDQFTGALGMIWEWPTGHSMTTHTHIHIHIHMYAHTHSQLTHNSLTHLYTHTHMCRGREREREREKVRERERSFHNTNHTGSTAHKCVLLNIWVCV